MLKREGQTIRYSLTNAPPSTDLATLAHRKCQRYFVERSLQDAKSELGMADFQALKYRAWEHHLALTLLASWFIADAATLAGGNVLWSGACSPATDIVNGSGVTLSFAIDALVFTLT